MQKLQNISAQRVSWVKSNKEALEKNADAIKNLYYPETIDELKVLVNGFNEKNIKFDLIGYSSNTLFLPSYHIDHLICTKKLNHWEETDTTIVCDCGANVAQLSKEMVSKGYKGFYGFIDLPGTIASGVYGNCGCYNCEINALVDHFTLLTESGEIKTLHVEDLKLQYRSTSLKRHEINGVILQVVLKKIQGNAEEEQKKALDTHVERKATQPNAANNLGTTFLGSQASSKMKIMNKIDGALRKICRIKDIKKRQNTVMKLMGAGKFLPYLFNRNRFMFYDVKAHQLFPEYIKYFKTLYTDGHLEIEIRK